MIRNKYFAYFTFFFSSILFSQSLPPLEIGRNPRWSKTFDQALINNVAFSPDGKIIATTEAHKVQIWDTFTGKLLSNVFTYDTKPMHLAFSGSGNLLITAAYGGSKLSQVKVWNISKKKLAVNLTSISEGSSVAVSPDDSTAAVSGMIEGDKSIMSVTVWDLKTGKLKAALRKDPADNYYPQSLIFSRDGKTLINSIQNKSHGIEIWDLNTNKLKNYIKTEYDVTEVALSPDEKFLAAGLYIAESRTRKPEGIIRIFAYPSMQKLYDLTGPKGNITSLSFHPNGIYLASGEFGSRPNFTIWNLQEKKAHYKNTSGNRPSLAARFSPDGKSIAVVLNTYGNLGNPDTLHMIDVGTADELKKSGASNDLNTFKIGEHVRVVIDGTEYSGIIDKISKHHYLLKMDNQKPEYWKWVEPGNLRPE